MTTKHENLREKFYKKFVNYYEGDSGIGGDTPQEPVNEWAGDWTPEEVLQFFLNEVEQEREKTIKEIIKDYSQFNDGCGCCMFDTLENALTLRYNLKPKEEK